MDPKQAMIVAPQQPEYEGLVMVVSPAEARQRLAELHAFVKEVMKPGLENDYGVIPGTKRKTLFQPGAQKLCEVYGLAQHFEDVEVIEDWDRPLFFYRKRCILTLRRDGRFICDGVGSANSREDRYGWRWVNEEDLPSDIDKSKFRRKSTDTRRGEWVQYRLPNDDVFSLVNTIEKMAAKRALIHAVQAATRSSDLFTEESEKMEIPEDAFGEADRTRSWAPEDERTEAQKVSEFERRLQEAADEKAVNSVAADIAKSDITVAAAGPLKKLCQDRLQAVRAEAKRAKSAEPEYDPHGDPEPPPRGSR